MLCHRRPEYMHACMDLPHLHACTEGLPLGPQGKAIWAKALAAAAAPGEPHCLQEVVIHVE